jgi:hypothetical protein
MSVPVTSTPTLVDTVPSGTVTVGTGGSTVGTNDSVAVCPYGSTPVTVTVTVADPT